jgi:predicted enzyme related to lactoylglutathione lyase
MGQPVVHFEIIGTDAQRLRSYYGDLFDWSFDTNPSVTGMEYGIVERYTTSDGIGIPGGVGGGMEGYDGHVTFYVAVPDVEAALQKAESLGGTRRMGPDPIPGTDTMIGHFTDPEGHLVGVVQAG